jgi:hypothetical protein
MMSKQPDLLILKLIQKLDDADPVIRRNAAGALRMQGSRAVASPERGLAVWRQRGQFDAVCRCLAQAVLKRWMYGRVAKLRGPADLLSLPNYGEWLGVPPVAVASAKG